MSSFHLAFPVKNLEKTREFFVNILGCSVGRHDSGWIDFDFFGHQVSAHLAPNACVEEKSSMIDGHRIPARHFGLILEWEAWENLVSRLKDKDVSFLVEPYVRFEGKIGEQRTFFVLEPSGNALEFKAFKDPSQIFAS